MHLCAYLCMCVYVFMSALAAANMKLLNKTSCIGNSEMNRIPAGNASKDKDHCYIVVASRLLTNPLWHRF